MKTLTRLAFPRNQAGMWQPALAEGAILLKVLVQNNEILFFFVQSVNVMQVKKRKFLLLSVGQTLQDEDYENLIFMDTLLLNNGRQVLHLFELKDPYRPLALIENPHN